MSNLPTETEVWIDEFGRRCSKAIEGVYEGDYWCVGATKKGTVCARDKDAAMALFKELTGEDAIKCGGLPYGSSPFLNVIVYKDGSLSTWGGFCFDPDKCMGYSSCPQRRACSE